MIPNQAQIESEDELACTPSATKNIGLRGIVVADSTICKVDGEQGTLIYRGYDAITLAKYSTYEEVVYLLLMKTLPGPAELEEFRLRLAEWRPLPQPVIDGLKTFPTSALPMDVLQAAVPALGMQDAELSDDSKDATYNKAVRLVARLSQVVSAWQRLRDGQKVVEPRPDFGQAANFLYTMFGKEPDEETMRDMDAAMILHAEHSFNASTFTARQVASTRAHIYAAISAAIGSLSGELHGGANSKVLRMLEEIGSPEKAHRYVIETLDKGGRIMGMGHPVYKVFDPRAEMLRDMSRRQSRKAGDTRWFEISEEVQRVTLEEFKRRKGAAIYPNVDFYSASAYRAMGIPMDMFTPIFAVARVAGWAAHYIEERFGEAQPKPTLYRPQAEYVGRYCGPEACEWVPLERR